MNITQYYMSLLSAGKQISVGNDKAFGRGLFIVDPEQAERKARKQNEYQQQLRIQMQEAKRRKEQTKRKEMEQDLRLQQKINEEIKKEQDRKNEKPSLKNDKNVTQPPERTQTSKIEMPRVQNKQRRREESPSNYKFDFRVNTETAKLQNPFLPPKRFDIMQVQEERYYDESNANRLRTMREALQQKMIEVFKKIKQSQNLEIDKEIDLIRKKIASSNTSYENQNPKLVQFQGEYSQFYKIPKKQNFYAQLQPKNLEYDSLSYQKRKQTAVQRDYKPVTQQKVQRHEGSRESRESSGEQLWGVKKGKNNYLSNREAINYQLNKNFDDIDTMLGKLNGP